MNLTLFLEPFHYILIENTYAEPELEWIDKELDFLCRPEILEDASTTGSAMSECSKPLKSNLGVWLDKVYKQKKTSPILTLSDRLMVLNDFFDLGASWFFKVNHCKNQSVLLSYYEDGDYYGPHYDHATITALTWFYSQPKQFEGGNLRFSDFNFEIECKHNHSILFPSQVKHEVLPITLGEGEYNSPPGRFTISQFMHGE